MKRYLICLCSLLVTVPVIAAQTNRTKPANYDEERVGTKGNVTTAHQVRVGTTSSSSTTSVTSSTSSQVDTREEEKEACTSRNSGAGNTFVWASKTNSSNYESMVEDTEKPKNNACFVRVTLKSKNPKIQIEESSKYFVIGEQETCGSWEKEEDIKQQILDSKKSGLVGGTIAGAVGGAVLGVGAMELFGNKAIGGKVQGQKALSDEQLLRSQMLAAGKEDEWKKYEESKKERSSLCEELHALGGKAPECDE